MFTLYLNMKFQYLKFATLSFVLYANVNGDKLMNNAETVLRGIIFQVQHFIKSFQHSTMDKISSLFNQFICQLTNFHSRYFKFKSIFIQFLYLSLYYIFLKLISRFDFIYISLRYPVYCGDEKFFFEKCHFVKSLIISIFKLKHY